MRLQGYFPPETFSLKAMDAKDDDMDSAKLDRLCDLLEKFLAQQGGSEEEEAEDELVPIPDTSEGRVNPLTAGDARSVLKNLQALRPFILANGDHKSKNAYDKAVTAVKSQIKLAERCEATDSRRGRNARAEAADFEASAARLHGKAIRLHGDVNAPDEEHRAEDSEQHEESFDEAVERTRQEQLKRFAPRKRR